MTGTGRPPNDLELSWRLSALAAASLSSLALAASPAAAQQTAPAGTEQPSDPCRVYAIEGTEGQPSELLASCRGRGVMLGLVSEFEAIHNEALQATLVDARLGDERRVLLLTTQDNGLPLVEDLAGQIALVAGRGPMSALDGIELDLSAFAETGELGVQPAPQDRAMARADRINVVEQIALERTRRQGAPLQD